MKLLLAIIIFQTAVAPTSLASELIRIEVADTGEWLDLSKEIPRSHRHAAFDLALSDDGAKLHLIAPVELGKLRPGVIDPFTIEVSDDGISYQQVMNPDDLFEKIKKYSRAHHLAGSAPVILIRVSDEIPQREVKGILTKVSRAGIQRVMIVANRS